MHPRPRTTLLDPKRGFQELRNSNRSLSSSMISNSNSTHYVLSGQVSIRSETHPMAYVVLSNGDIFPCVGESRDEVSINIFELPLYHIETDNDEKPVEIPLSDKELKFGNAKVICVSSGSSAHFVRKEPESKEKTDRSSVDLKTRIELMQNCREKLEGNLGLDKKKMGCLNRMYVGVFSVNRSKQFLVLRIETTKEEMRAFLFWDEFEGNVVCRSCRSIKEIEIIEDIQLRVDDEKTGKLCDLLLVRTAEEGSRQSKLHWGMVPQDHSKRDMKLNASLNPLLFDVGLGKRLKLRRDSKKKKRRGRRRSKPKRRNSSDPGGSKKGKRRPLQKKGGRLTMMAAPSSICDSSEHEYSVGDDYISSVIKKLPVLCNSIHISGSSVFCGCNGNICVFDFSTINANGPSCEKFEFPSVIKKFLSIFFFERHNVLVVAVETVIGENDIYFCNLISGSIDQFKGCLKSVNEGRQPCVVRNVFGISALHPPNESTDSDEKSDGGENENKIMSKWEDFLILVLSSRIPYGAEDSQKNDVILRVFNFEDICKEKYSQNPTPMETLCEKGKTLETFIIKHRLWNFVGQCFAMELNGNLEFVVSYQMKNEAESRSRQDEFGFRRIKCEVGQGMKQLININSCQTPEIGGETLVGMVCVYSEYRIGSDDRSNLVNNEDEDDGEDVEQEFLQYLKLARRKNVIEQEGRNDGELNSGETLEGKDSTLREWDIREKHISLVESRVKKMLEVLKSGVCNNVGRLVSKKYYFKPRSVYTDLEDKKPKEVVMLVTLIGRMKEYMRETLKFVLSSCYRNRTAGDKTLDSTTCEIKLKELQEDLKQFKKSCVMIIRNVLRFYVKNRERMFDYVNSKEFRAAMKTQYDMSKSFLSLSNSRRSKTVRFLVNVIGEMDDIFQEMMTSIFDNQVLYASSFVISQLQRSISFLKGLEEKSPTKSIVSNRLPLFEFFLEFEKSFLELKSINNYDDRSALCVGSLMILLEKIASEFHRFDSVQKIFVECDCDQKGSNKGVIRAVVIVGELQTSFTVNTFDQCRSSSIFKKCLSGYFESHQETLWKEKIQEFVNHCGEGIFAPFVDNRLLNYIFLRFAGNKSTEKELLTHIERMKRLKFLKQHGSYVLPSNELESAEDFLKLGKLLRLNFSENGISIFNGGELFLDLIINTVIPNRDWIGLCPFYDISYYRENNFGWFLKEGKCINYYITPSKRHGVKNSDNVLELLFSYSKEGLEVKNGKEESLRFSLFGSNDHRMLLNARKREFVNSVIADHFLNKEMFENLKYLRRGFFEEEKFHDSVIVQILNPVGSSQFDDVDFEGFLESIFSNSQKNSVCSVFSKKDLEKGN